MPTTWVDFKELRARVLVGEFGGAAGTLASLGGRGLEVQAELMRELGLGVPAIAWHTVRDTIAETGCFLGLLAGTCAKIAFDVKLLMQTEVEEVFEPFHQGVHFNDQTFVTKHSTPILR